MFRRMDLLLLGITIVLTLFGLAMIASVSVFESYQLTERLVNQGSRETSTNAFYLWRSFSHVIVGLLGMLFTMIVPYRLWERLALPLFALTMFLLLAVFVPGLRAEYGTAYSWLYIGSFSLQPSELLKLTFIFYLAIWLQKREQLIGTFKEGFLPFAILLTVSTMLIALQPDLGSFLVISGIAAVMF
ncbi:MAG: FtsW/RodA/SpoVE family cell cycle protein, partial [Candidatus Peribacteraceae bacterium]|nr:FtsW/RodA/SpoVE family cell cycle protein [Candidatus Peribacteraceae bacterium]